jgi:tRNA modification GTPase
MIREGATVVIAGRPNVGKSSLFNMLAGHDRAIVTEVAGTTRDLVTERIDLAGLPITLVDTAGWRDTSDVVEREGVARAAKARDIADLLLVVIDRSEPITDEDTQLLELTANRNRLIVANKSDLAGRLKPAPTYAEERPAAACIGEGNAPQSYAGNAPQSYVGNVPPSYVGAGFSRPVDVAVSALTGDGAAELRQAIVNALTGRESLRDTAAISNTRHIALVDAARASLVDARNAAEGENTPEEFVLTDLQAARAHLDEIVGVRTSEDVLQHIFAKFCIGK